MANWYDEGLVALHEDIVEITRVSLEDVKSVYSYLVNEGLIDYDIEKEYIYDRYGDDGFIDEEEG